MKCYRIFVDSDIALPVRGDSRRAFPEAWRFLYFSPINHIYNTNAGRESIKNGKANYFKSLFRDRLKKPFDKFLKQIIAYRLLAENIKKERNDLV